MTREDADVIPATPRIPIANALIYIVETTMKPKILYLALSLAAVLLAGCSKSPANAAAAATNQDAAKAALSNAVANANKSTTPTPCETDFSARDAAEILTGSTALNRYAMNAALGEAENGCEMGDGNGALIDFAIRAKPPMQGDNRQEYKTLTSFLQPKGVPFAGRCT